MDFIVIPFEGTDKIKIGMTSNEIQSILLKQPRKFKKTIYDKFESDDFGFCQVFYEESGKSEAFEFSKPAQVFLNSVPLINQNYINIEKYFKSIDNSLNFDGGAGFVSLENDIGIYAPDAPDGVVETVLIAKKGYYKSAFGL